MPDASECSNDGYCVDDDGERVTELGSSVSTTNGDADEPGASERCADALPLGVCVASWTQDGADETLLREWDFEGTVLAMGDEQPSSVILPDGEHAACAGASTGFDPSGEFAWAYLGSGENFGRVLVGGPGAELPFSVGDLVRVRQRAELANLFSWITTVEIRDEDGELLLWFGAAAVLELLALPPEIVLGQGEERCPKTFDCFDTLNPDLSVTVGSESVDLMQGESAEVGGFVVTNSAFQIGTPSNRCVDADPHYVRVALWRATPLPRTTDAGRASAECSFASCATDAGTSDGGLEEAVSTPDE